MKSVIDFTLNHFEKYISHDFDRYSGVYSFLDVDRVKLKGSFIKISIKDGEVFVSQDSTVNNKTRKAITHLESVICNGHKLGVKFPNVSFVYSTDTTGLRDEEIGEDLEQLPIFTLCNPKGFNFGIRIPNMYFGDVFEYEKRMSLKRKISDLMPFDQRRKKIYFRGGASGAGSLPRIKLTSTFESDPRFDVNVVSKPKSSTLFKTDLDQISNPLANHQPNLSNCFYQYVVHMPGSAKNEAYSYGLQELLPWGSAVIFIAETCYEWYYEKLIEEKLVLVTDLDHLEEDINVWFKDEEFAQNKARLSNKFSENYLNKDTITAYWYLTLLKYSEAYDGLGKSYNSKMEPREEVDLDYLHLKMTFYFLKLKLKPLAFGLNNIVMIINKISRRLKGR